MRAFLKSKRDDITSYLRLNLESPKRVQSIIDEVINFLNQEKYSGSLKEKVEIAIQELLQAKKTAKSFESGLLSDLSSSNDLAAKTEKDLSSWYIGVIGTSESAIDLITSHLNHGR